MLRYGQRREAVLGHRRLATLRGITNRLSLPEATLTASNIWTSAKTVHWLADDVNGEVLVKYPNFRVTSGAPSGGGCMEFGSGAPATATAQVTYTSVITGLSATLQLVDPVTGLSALSAVDGGFFDARPDGIVKAARGTSVTLEFRGQFPLGGVYSQRKSVSANGERCQWGTSGQTQPALGAALTNTLGAQLAWYGPSLIAASSSKPVCCPIGDSRTDGLRDDPNTTYGDQGAYPRILGPAGLAYVNVSGRGDTAASFNVLSNSARRRELAAYATYPLIALGINDLGVSSTPAADLVVLNQAIIDSLALRGAPVWQTLDPRTTGGITTPPNAGNEIIRRAYNALVRGMPIYFDPAIALEDASVPGAWGSATYVYTDFLHEVNVGNARAALLGPLAGVSPGMHGIAAR